MVPNRPPEVQAAMRAERDALAAEIAADRANLTLKEARLNAYDFILNGVMNSAASGPLSHATAPPMKRAPGRSREGTLTEFVLRQIDGAEFGLTRKELAGLISISKFAEQHRVNPNGFYNLLNRAKDRKEVREVNGRFYGPHRAPVPPPPGSRAEPTPAPGEPQNWLQQMAKLLRESAEGQTTDDLKARMMGTVWEEKMDGQPGIVYSALTRLLAKGKASRRGQLWFDPDVYKRILAGELDAPLPPEDGPKDRMADVLIAILQEHGPLTPAEVLAKARENPAVAERIGGVGDLVYTYLSKLKRRNLLVKVDGRYDVPGRALNAGGNVVQLASKTGGQTQM